MSKKDSSYWEERIANQTWRQYNSIESKNRAIIEHYQRVLKEIQHALYDYAGEDGTLSRSKLYEKKHLKSLQKEIADKVSGLTEQFESIAKENMQEGIKNNSENIFKVLNNTGVNANDNLIEKVYDQEWKGSFFSERLWSDAEKLANQLNINLTQGLTQGKTVTQMAIDVQNVMGSRFNDTVRVIRSETMHALNESTLQSYKASGIQYVRIWSAEDERTCPSCSKYHNKPYRIDKVPTLPIHPNCRCTLIPVLDDEIESLRLSDSNGDLLYNYVKHDSITGVNSTEQFKSLFTYVDSLGNINNPFDESLNILNLEVQKEVGEGILYIQDQFKIKSLPPIVVKKGMRAWGKFVVNTDGRYEIQLSSKLNKSIKQAFPTAIHELTHYINSINYKFDKRINLVAKNNLKLSKKEYEKLVFDLIAVYDIDYLNDDSELLSFSIEREATNKGNKLSKEIDRIFRKELEK